MLGFIYETGLTGSGTLLFIVRKKKAAYQKLYRHHIVELCCHGNTHSFHRNGLFLSFHPLLLAIQNFKIEMLFQERGHHFGTVCCICVLTRNR